MARTRSVMTGVRVNSPVPSAHRRRVCLDGEWKLKLDPKDRGRDSQWYHKALRTDMSIPVPGCVQQLDTLARKYPPEITLRNTYEGTAWYEKTFQSPQPADDELVWLALGGVGPAAYVWVNGTYIGYHAQAFVAIAWNITDALRSGTNRVTIAVVEQDTSLLGGIRCRAKWSGLYRGVEVLVTKKIMVQEIELRPDPLKKRLYCRMRCVNHTGKRVRIQPTLEISTAQGNNTKKRVKLDAGEMSPRSARDIETTVSCSMLSAWTPEEPVLYVATVSLHAGQTIQDSLSERFGLRSLHTSKNGILLNGNPYMLRGLGTEFCSPTISPLTDRTIITRRIAAMKQCGFNFFRAHTHAPTAEELDVADEMGFLFCAETGIISNFNRCEPFGRALVILRNMVRQTRNHASLVMYCLGNEGAQLMVVEPQRRRKGKRAYEEIKKHAPAHLALTSFGHQGEVPQVPNDVETPHLWSDYFRWAYRGLSDVRWELLSSLLQHRPSIIHEYGKYTVWPDPAEKKYLPPHGSRGACHDIGHEALEKTGLLALKKRVIASSRTLGLQCWKIAIEMARRQPGTDGYTIWTGLRNGFAQSGFIDDTGSHIDGDPEEIRTQFNGPTAVLIDRDFEGRTLQQGERVNIAVSLSHFGDRAIRNATGHWTLSDTEGNQLHHGTLARVRCGRGENRTVGTVSFIPAHETKARQCTLTIAVKENGKTRARNTWDFWVFPPVARRSHAKMVVYAFKDTRFRERFRYEVPGAVRLRDFDSMLRGAAHWWGQDHARALQRYPDTILVTDHMGEHVNLWLQRKKPVLFVDTDHYPDTWYPEPMIGQTALQCEPYDVSKLFAPFRSTQDQGPVVSLVHSHPVFRTFPHQGFCDLQFYAMIQDARPLVTRKVLGDTRAARSDVLVHNICKLPKPWESNSENRTYAIEKRISRTRVLVTSFRFFEDPAGRYLFDGMLDYLCT